MGRTFFCGDKLSDLMRPPSIIIQLTKRYRVPLPGENGAFNGKSVFSSNPINKKEKKKSPIRSSWRIGECGSRNKAKQSMNRPNDGQTAAQASTSGLSGWRV
jgi:hypothetical protein